MRWTIPRLWPDATVAIIASGPSVNESQARYAGQRADYTICINNSWQLWPQASLLYAADGLWWAKHGGVPDFNGLKVTQDEQAARLHGLLWIRSERKAGLSFDPSVIHRGGCGGGHSSGFQALNIAVLLGAARIILLGFDARAGENGSPHWHGRHPVGLNNPGPDLYRAWVASFETAVADLQRAHVDVVNCSPGSAITAFPKAELRAVL